MLAVYDKSEGRWSIADEPVCTARWATPSRSHDAGDPCGQPATGRVGDVDLCPHHYRRALDWFFECHVPEAPERHEAARKEQAKRARLAAEARSIVYFLRRESDGLVKIGFTTGYRSRLASLRGEHGALRLLLAIAGHREREREMHLKFAAQRVAGEWFRADEALLFAVLQARNSLGRLQETRLPGQVPMSEIRALLKAARAVTRAS